MARTSALAALLLATLAVVSAGSRRCEAASATTHVLEHRGRRRTYHVVVPRAFDKRMPAPLVLALHGGGGSGSGFDAMTRGQFAREADRRKWLVAFPEGVAKGWNDGRPLRSLRDRRRRGVDDVGFLRAVIDRLHATHNIDRTRVYATGISNGGFMSYRLGLELSDRIAAIAPVTANLPKVHAGKKPAHAVGLMVINGTRDPLVPYQGGHVRVLGMSRGEILSTKDTVQRWLGFNGCSGEPKVDRLPDKSPSDGTRTVRKTWTGCTGGAAVVLYRVENGGHTWPGGKQYLATWVIGRTSRDFDAVPAIFDFFALHRRMPAKPAKRAPTEKR